MTRSVYSLLLYLLAPLVVLYLGFRSIKSADYRKRWSERFGFSKLVQTDVLFHCVSMGETLAAVDLIKQLMQQYPAKKFTITTTSPTGSEQVTKAFGDSVQHCYLPLDFSYAVQRFLNQVNPKVCVIMETELWPNLVHFANKRGVELILANARLSQKSADKYQAKPKLSIPMLKTLDKVLVQTQTEAERFFKLGVDTQRVQVTGSVKFDINIDASKREQAHELRSLWQRQTAPVWVAGSVHPGEFDIMLQAHKQVLAHYPNALLIMAPRHPEQFDAAAKAANIAGLNLLRRSEGQAVGEQTQVLLGDSMGELLMLYGTADQAFVGGTLIENGGHNPLEPAAMGLNVFVGPHHWDFAEITQLLKQAGGLKVVAADSAESGANGSKGDDLNHAQPADELAQLLLLNWDDKQAHQQQCKAALAVVEQNKGALKAHFDAISPVLAG
ncbi:3-deoxy-D-manno-octulosonic acid transferase [Shewanella sp. WXL01]|uniref:lipid IV(A) 3-deoxy-D-manno-octulosonic acid transferase n=1 Tax=Shewanella sp. WXL01 TaxID=2709721 RepID=UPI0014385E5D|nr:lipid IV(A) 3-deoxy-D-manno-octulosonic acid transferase [Shewanella sp. WXL01]NKF52054.1 3-deoxy-D-manno-octulosonic acid transferase [Shewanella sp. WXL01]